MAGAQIMKSCTSGTIKGATARFCNIIDIQVKCKTKQIGENKGDGLLFMVMRNLWPTLTLYGDSDLMEAGNLFKAAASTSHSTLQSFPTPVDSQATAPVPTVKSYCT